MATFKIDDRDFVKAAKALDKAGFALVAGQSVASTLVKSANAVRRNVRAAAKPHRRTGRMSGHVQYKRQGTGLDTVIDVKAGGSIAHLVARGAKPHDITPHPGTRGMTIRGHGASNSADSGRGSKGIQAAGADVFAVRTRVHHPGYHPPSNFWDDGVAASQPEIVGIAKAGAQQMADKLAVRLRAR